MTGSASIKKRKVLRQKRLASPRVVLLGGGTGLSTLLSGLKLMTDQMTAIVAVTDEGGSSGRLRKTLGVLPPGDIRNCLVALAKDDTLLSKLFQYRFPETDVQRQKKNGPLSSDTFSLEGHAFGNLFLTALSEVAGGFDRALIAASRVLAIQGKVLPVSLKTVRLKAILEDGSEIVGEPQISHSQVRIRRVGLTPYTPPPSPGVIEAIHKADVIVLGPGSLYTSVIPPLLVKGVLEALSHSKALKIYVCNLMTQPGETNGYSAVDHIQALLDHCKSGYTGRSAVDVMLVNNKLFSPEILKHYKRYHSYPVSLPKGKRIGDVSVVRRSLAPTFSVGNVPTFFQARHASRPLAKAVIDLWRRNIR